MTGTTWTPPEQGSTVTELRKAFNPLRPFGETPRTVEELAARTNLRLTGTPITEEDWARLESDVFQMGGQNP